MNKIQVTQPTFLINLDNPTEVSYVPMEGNWKSIIVQTYQNGFPEIQDNEILYVYKENRGYIKKQQVMNKVNEAGYNEVPKFGPSQNNPPYVSDDFQIGPDGAYEHTEDITPKEKAMTDKELQNVPQMISAKMAAQQQLINLLYSQVMNLTMMSKIELGDDVIAEIKRLKEIINEKTT
jgi:hypothetical protein